MILSFKAKIALVDPVVYLHFLLERVLQRELNDARTYRRARNFTKASLVQSGVRNGKLRMVEGIEKFGAELHSCTFLGLPQRVVVLERDISQLLCPGPENDAWYQHFQKPCS